VSFFDSKGVRRQTRGYKEKGLPCHLVSFDLVEALGRTKEIKNFNTRVLVIPEEGCWAYGEINLDYEFEGRGKTKFYVCGGIPGDGHLVVKKPSKHKKR
jgi:hypothetical protein